MDETQLAVGDAVTVTDEDGGELFGHVTAFEQNGNVAVVTPVDEAVRRWYPKGYRIGSAHWGTRLVRKVAG